MTSIVVTGANRGIGLGLVKELLKDSSYGVVYATTRKLGSAKDLIAIKDPRLHVVELDADSDASVKNAAQKISSELGDSGLDVLVNNAGVLIPVVIDAPIDRKKAAENFNVNAIGTMIVTQNFLPTLKKAAKAKGKATVVNISSILGSIEQAAGSVPPRYFEAYSMSKAAVNHFTRTLSIDFKQDNIVAVALCPGWVQTDMGGEAAPISVQESTTNLASTIKKIGKQHSGLFFDNKLSPYKF